MDIHLKLRLSLCVFPALRLSLLLLPICGAVFPLESFTLSSKSIILCTWCDWRKSEKKPFFFGNALLGKFEIPSAMRLCSLFRIRKDCTEDQARMGGERTSPGVSKPAHVLSLACCVSWVPFPSLPLSCTICKIRGPGQIISTIPSGVYLILKQQHAGDECVLLWYRFLCIFSETERFPLSEEICTQKAKLASQTSSLRSLVVADILDEFMKPDARPKQFPPQSG